MPTLTHGQAMRLGGALVASLILISCGSSSTCVVGSTQPCLCVGGGSGVQICVAGGTYGACTCGGTDGGPMLDSGPHDGGSTGTDLGPIDSSTCDSDGDGHDAISCVGGDDCDDTDASRYPGHTEVCDSAGHDDDCNVATLGPDADSDGVVSTACCNTQASGSLLCGTDCLDTEADVHPGAPEACDGFDNDCNGLIDDGLGMAYYADCDGDGYGGTGPGGAICAPPTAPPTCTGGVTGTWISTAGDCNDAIATIHPGAMEACNSIDDNCNGVADEGAGTTWYRDLDHDLQGAAASGTVIACLMPAGYAPDNTDCNDMCASCYVGATEICDMRDNDCNGVTDETIGAACTSGVGACANSGYLRCDGTCSATAGSPDPTFHTMAAPNGSWDWNCDGAVTGSCGITDTHTNPTAYCAGSGPPPCPDIACGLTGAPVGSAPYCGQSVWTGGCTTTGSGGGCTLPYSTSVGTQTCR